MVERNLAKVEVESSRLFSRSKFTLKGFKKGQQFAGLFCSDGQAGVSPDRQGAVAKRLCTGLQIRLAQFDSGSRLQKKAVTANSNGFLIGLALLVLVDFPF